MAFSIWPFRRRSFSAMMMGGRPSAAASPGTSVVMRSSVILTFSRARPV